jgi:hypothetical protein
MPRCLARDAGNRQIRPLAPQPGPIHLMQFSSPEIMVQLFRQMRSGGTFTAGMVWRCALRSNVGRGVT